MRANPIRFSGMASGMDTDSIVKDMMRPQQYKIDKEKKAQALVKLRQDAWKDMNKKLFDFHTKFTQKMSLKSTYDKNVITSSNSNAIEIGDETAVPAGTHEFKNIELATAASVTGAKINVAAETRIGGLMGIGENGVQLRMTVTDVDGKKIPVTVDVAGDNTLQGVARKMNDELQGTGFTARYDEANGRFFLNSTKTGEQAIEFNSIHEITTPAKPAEEGKEATLAEVSESAIDGGFKKLGLGRLATDMVIVPGKGSSYEYNGIKIEGHTNQIEVNGIKATLKANTIEPVIISSVPDPDATYNVIKEFVTEYNKLIEEINLKVGTKPGKDIEPLTSEEREAMSESDIKLWDEKLNASLFYKDPELTKFLDSARSILSSQFGADLAKLGIVTGSWEERGKLHILGDEDDEFHSKAPNKLKEALNRDPQAVADKFYEVGQALYKTHNATFTKSSKLKSAMNFYNDKIMTDKLKGFDKQISTLEDRMYKMEEIQFRKFAVMEKMLSQLNSQGSWLAQQFGGN